MPALTTSTWTWWTASLCPTSLSAIPSSSVWSPSCRTPSSTCTWWWLNQDRYYPILPRNRGARIFKLLKEPKNRFQGINPASLCSLEGRYDNPISTLFLAFLDSHSLTWYPVHDGAHMMVARPGQVPYRTPPSFLTIGSPNFYTFKEPKNRFQGITSASLSNLPGRYDNHIPTRH